MSTSPDRYVRYYRSILKRIADGWDTPASLAELALDWDLHEEGCSYNKGDYNECDCDPAHPASKESQSSEEAKP